MSPSVGTKGLSKAIGVIQGGEMTEPEGSIHFSACLKTKVTHQGVRVHLRGQSDLSRVSACASRVTVIFPEGVVTFSGTPAFLPGGVTFCPI